MFMGDDGNNNLHMNDENDNANYIEALHPEYVLKKVMWDAYTEQASATGHSYPEVSAIIKRQQQNGALIMDYAGHGSATLIAHEGVLKLSDFQTFSNANLPLWITASCDIMAFDDVEDNIGTAAVVRPSSTPTVARWPSSVPRARCSPHTISSSTAPFSPPSSAAKTEKH